MKKKGLAKVVPQLEGKTQLTKLRVEFVVETTRKLTDRDIAAIEARFREDRVGDTDNPNRQSVSNVLIGEIHEVNRPFNECLFVHTETGGYNPNTLRVTKVGR